MSEQAVRPEVPDEALGSAIEAEEYEHDGRRVKRDPEKLMRVREGLNAEARVARSGNVLERAVVGAVRQG
ncbi:hypothetical protein [Pseudodesulfovibrio pelocollis]|uniref:hypothetical protein n=1 Tax=Pseudodesulfovibrio pelocollis TaxID=3051432 RepID=UPI00255B246D|nr:hypothetical protein [Pseudodesulfovibrio sp. SB368]